MHPFKSYGKVDDLDQERLAVQKRAMRRIIVISVASVVLVAIIASVVAGVVVSNRNKGGSGSGTGLQATNKALKAVCDITLYPATCISSLSSYTSTSNAGPKELANLAVTVALDEAKKASDWIQKTYDSTHNMALLDCVELMNATIEQLNSSSAIVQSFDLASLQDETGDVQTWLSASQTNLGTCLDGLETMAPNDQVKAQIQSTLNNLTEITSNALAIVKGISAMLSSLKIPGFPSRRLMSDPEDELQSFDDDFPKWLSAGDRRLLQKTSVAPNVTVASDGTGQYRTVQAAIDAAPESKKRRYVIKVKQGIYHENVLVPSEKPLITIIGDGMDNTIILGNRSVVDNSTTFASATFAAVGKGFIARDIQFINIAGPQKYQAVALRSGSDKSIFYRCKIVGYQDTLYAHSLRQFYKDSEIWGTVDFIFGNAAVVFQNCTIRARKPLVFQQNTLTAQGRTDPNMNTGISIHKCNVVPTPDLIPVKTTNPTYLGRPWKLYSRTVVMQSELADIIAPAGWLYWNATFALDTLFYREFNNSGPGSVTKNRVTWPGYRATTFANVVIPFTVPRFIGDSWIKSAGITYDQTL